MLLTIIVPCFNEKKTIKKILKIIKKQKIKSQVIVVDDGSTDGTKQILIKLKKIFIDKLIFHKKNYGKGAAIITAKKFIKGDVVIIQDADLEYSPKDYKYLVKPIIEGKTNVVYGSRVLNKNRYLNNDFSSIFRIFANHVLTILSNLINNQSLTDAHTCYKVIRAKVFKKIKLCEKGFSFCPELTTKLSIMNEKIIELPISYKGRTYEEGKKINFFDGLRAIKTLIKYKLETK
tara:strand:+ start:382 stop:1080 length:699 start_codon:yes stop_codon:yes gene_type:complete